MVNLFTISYQKFGKFSEKFLWISLLFVSFFYKWVFWYYETNIASFPRVQFQVTCIYMSCAFFRNVGKFIQYKAENPKEDRNRRMNLLKKLKINFKIFFHQMGKIWIAMNEQLPQFHIYSLINVFPFFTIQSKCTATTRVKVFCSHLM